MFEGPIQPLLVRLEVLELLIVVCADFLHSLEAHLVQLDEIVLVDAIYEVVGELRAGCRSGTLVQAEDLRLVLGREHLFHVLRHVVDRLDHAWHHVVLPSLHIGWIILDLLHRKVVQIILHDRLEAELVLHLAHDLRVNEILIDEVLHCQV